MALFSYRPPEASGGIAPPEQAAPSAAPDHATQATRVRLFSAVNSMPPLPAVLTQLLGMLNKEDSSSAAIAGMIERDSVLSGSVLRCVNSAYYGVSNKVSSIRHAVTLLGFATVRNLALAFSMRRMMQGAQPSADTYTAYSRHALGCALMTQFLAHLTRSPDLEASFAAGLFHDIGKLLIFTTVPELMPAIIEEWENGTSYLDAERDILGVTHPELSAAVVNAWKLPEEIELAVRCHHDPASAGLEGTPGAVENPPSLAWLLHVADAGVKHAGLEVVSSEKRPPADAAELFQKLGLGRQLDDIMGQFQVQFEDLQTAFS